VGRACDDNYGNLHLIGLIRWQTPIVKYRLFEVTDSFMLSKADIHHPPPPLLTLALSCVVGK